MTARKMELLEQKTQLLAYTAAKLKAGDYHAVADGAMDLREIDAALVILSELEHAEIR